MEVDNEGRMRSVLRSVFLADEVSKSTYLIFGYVIVFDVTYRSNNLNLLFAPFVVVNHYMQPIVIGCTLLA